MFYCKSGTFNNYFSCSVNSVFPAALRGCCALDSLVHFWQQTPSRTNSKITFFVALGWIWWICQPCSSFLFTNVPQSETILWEQHESVFSLTLRHVLSSFSWGKELLICRSPKEALLHLGPFPGGVLFHCWLPLCVLAAMHHSSLQANLTNEQRSEQRGCSSRSGAPILTDALSSLLTSKRSSQSQTSNSKR